MNPEQYWERLVILELNQEYARICRVRQLRLRPLSIQLFDSQSVWGQFDHLSRSILLSRNLIKNHSWQDVLGVLNHEMAHQYVHEMMSRDLSEKPHGESFQRACRILGVPAQYAKASVGLQSKSLDWKDDDSVSPQNRVILKAKKLLSLAQSSNEYEAGLAMRKVQELFAQYNLDQTHLSDRSQFVHLVMSNGKKRKTAWEQRIISILIESFFVEIILKKQFNAKTGEADQAFEMIGTRENVLMAEYVYYFLKQQLESLCKKANPSTRSQKSSYRLGILEGFAEKLKGSPSVVTNPSQSVIERALVQFKNDPFLEKYLKEIYPKLTLKRNSSRLVDTPAFLAGQQVGQKLILHKPLASSKKSGLLIS